MQRAIRPVLLLVALGSFFGMRLALAEPVTRVYLNGAPTPVHFSDGDTFRVLAGSLRGSSARMSGFNTLESFGPVHRWGDWNEREMYALSKLATLNARRGVWHCTSNMDRDTYGRILAFCLDLGLDQIRRGYAHAMTVDLEHGDERFLEAQRDAITHRRGMWAHGVPAYVLTSAHATRERSGSDAKTYDRLVSTFDGHSAKRLHDNDYDECAWVCGEERHVGEKALAAFALALRSDADVADVITTMSDARLEQLVRDGSILGFSEIPEDPSGKLASKLESLVRSSDLGRPDARHGSCFRFVEFDRRYGTARPECLK